MMDKLGNTIFEIVIGEITISTGVWDYELEGPTLTIRNGLRDIMLKMDFLKNGLNIYKGVIEFDKEIVKIEKSYVEIVPNRRLSGMGFEN
jgi:hypothetical protein